jgi:hypothetical protein
VCALGRQPDGTGQADSGTAPGDESGLSFK